MMDRRPKFNLLNKRFLKVVLLLFLFFLASNGLGLVPTVDAVASAVTQLGSEASQYGTSKTLSSFTVPAGTDRLLVVVASDSKSTNVTGVTFNGTPMTEVIEDNDGFAVDSIYVLLMGTSASPTTGDIIMTSSGGASDERFMAAVVYANVDQTTPTSSAMSRKQSGGGPITSNLTITSEDGDLVFDLFDSFNSAGGIPSHTVGAGQTQLHDQGTAISSGGFGHTSTSTEDGAVSVTSTWTTSGTALLHIALNINAAVFSPIAPEPDNHPTSFTAITNSTSQITTSWTDSTGTNLPSGYLVLCNQTGTFTNPVDGTAQTDDTNCSDGAGVQNIAQGTGTVAWTGLNSDTQYFFKIFPFSNSGAAIDYKTNGTPGTANATTLKAEPTNHPTSFTAAANSSSQITTSWTDSTGGTLPDGYLVLCNLTGTFTNPTDAVAQSDDTNCSDGAGVKNVSHGAGGSFAWTGLNSGTQYFFKIFPYSNAGSNIDYKTNGTPPTANATTHAPEIAVLGGGQLIPDGDTTPQVADDTDFGSLEVNNSALTHTFTISNSGLASLDLSGSPLVDISGHASDFSVTQQPVLDPLGANMTTTFQVKFDPTTTGLRSATISIANNDSDENPYNYDIQGTGIATQLTVTKVVTNDHGGNLMVGSFPLFVDGGMVTSGSTLNVTPGSHTFTETNQSGYAASYGGDCDSSGNVTLMAGESKSCTLFNDDIPATITVNKVLVPPTDTGVFSLTINSTTVATGGNGTSTGAINVVSGTHTIGELGAGGTNLADYNTVIGSDCAANGSVTVILDQDVTCVITNTRKVGQLTITKVLSPTSDGGLFDLQIDSTDLVTDVGNGGTTGVITVTTGIHSVGETAGSGTNLTNYTSAIECRDSGGSGSVVANASNAGPLNVTVNENDNIVCVITNLRRGTIEIEKLTSPAGGSGFGFTTNIPGGPAGFNLNHSATQNFTQIAPGSYTVTENNPAPIYGLNTLVCDDDASLTPSVENLGLRTATINLDPGESVRCTFTNIQAPGTVVIAKANTLPHPQNFTFTTTMPAGTFVLDHPATDDGDSVTQVVTYSVVGNATYTVTEADPGLVGFDLTGLQCAEVFGTQNSTVNLGSRTATLTVEPNEIVGCVFTNTARTGSVTITEDATPPDGTDLNFTSDLPSNTTFSLDDAVPNDGDSVTATRTVSGLNFGTYTITQADPGLLTLSNIQCDDEDSLTTSLGNVVSRTATVGLDPGETVNCTFTNNQGTTFIYLPIVLKNYDVAPDLVVQSVTATNGNVTVIIENQGNASVVDAFWVDAYINPTTTPTGVNQRWQDLGSQGLLWGVQGAALPILPGGTLTLTLNDAHYFGPPDSNVNLPLTSGTTIYAQVDSRNFTPGTTYGGVLENHEIRGETYNNISPTVNVAGSGAGEVKLQEGQSPSSEGLPPR